ncbi:MAG: hypothetical protein Q7U75_19410 [Desulfobacterales bacterium]|nr:hypothetical protein [Desulfobacterales bacterium]
MAWKRSKTDGTGMSESHIGRANLNAIEAAATAAAPAPFVEPAVPAPGCMAFWVTPGDPALDPSAGALMAIWTNEVGTVRRVAVGSGIGPGPVPIP